MIAVTILTFFEDRHYRLIHGHGTNGKKNWKRVVYTVVHYLISVVFIAPGYMNIPDQAVGKATVKKVSDDLLANRAGA